MSKLIECVPNFSEGRDPQKLERIAEAIRGFPGVTLLDYSGEFALVPLSAASEAELSDMSGGTCV